MLTRRRFITIAAAAGALPVPPLTQQPAAAIKAPMSWHGIAMGAMASISIDHPDPRAGQLLIDNCVQEIERLEKILSLYRSNSALMQLNRSGRLDDAPPELIEVLNAAVSLAHNSNGAFDPTVQPLYELYDSHFSNPDADPDGPAPERVKRALEYVDYSAIVLDTNSILFKRYGMSVTLNGIAQGYITDRIANLIRAEGLDNILIDLGEFRASGSHPAGRPWYVGIADPENPHRALVTVNLPERHSGLPALATSGGYGTRFNARGDVHHLFDPVVGKSVSYYRSVSVNAPTALLADGLSTALYVSPPTQCKTLIEHYAPAKAFIVNADNTLEYLD